MTGPSPPTPIQRWFFDRDLPEPGHFNQSTLLETDRPVDPAVLGRAVTALIEHHDALRSRFHRDHTGWTGHIDAPRAVETGPVGSAATVWLAGAIESPERVATQANRSLDPAIGPLFRVVLFDRPEGVRLLLLVAHHLVVDAVSWPIVIADLVTAYERAEAGSPTTRLAAKTTSFADWSRRLTELAGSAELASEAAYWDEVTEAGAALPRDGAGSNTVGDAREVRVSLDEEWTGRLLTELPGVFRTQVNDVLLAVLGVVLCSWARSGPVLVDVEGHGREDVGPDVDVSRTVGWFTSIYPVALAAGGDLGAVLRETKERLRRVPRRGLGFGLLRYLTGWTPRHGAQVSFNHLGHLFQASDGPAVERFRPASWSMGRTESDRGERAYLIEINSRIVGGRLEMVWTYGPHVHSQSTVERLAERYLAVMRDLVEACLRPDAGGYTPSDFPLSGLDQAGVDLVAARAGGPVDDVYPLTPLQAGMLFHTRLATEPGANWVQSGLLLEGGLDLDAFRRAWELVFDRFEVLRTAVVWDGVPAPLAVVHRLVPLPWEEHDLADRDEAARERAVADYLAADRARGADFTAPALVRLAVLRLAHDRHQVVWSYHHLLLDGWSLPIVVGELLGAYHALRAGERPRFASRRPFRDFVAWSAGQDLTAAEAYWRERLAGVTEPTALGVERDTGDRGQGIVQAPAVPDLVDFARRHRLTVNTVVQGAWAVLMSVYSGRSDVVFGVTSSGRGGQVAGMEAMVGLLMNTTPARVVVDRGAPVVEWLRALQEEQVAGRRFEHTPLPVIQACSGVPAGRQLFNALFVFENYPINDIPRHDTDPGALRMAVNHADDGREGATNVPLSVIASAARELNLILWYDRGRFDQATVERMAAHLATILTAIVADTGRRVGELTLLTAAERQRMLVDWNDSGTPVEITGAAPEVIAARAAAIPDAPAVIRGAHTVTYGALLTKANRLAHLLRDAGVGAETIVGLCLDDALDMVTAVLAVWQAGGAYLPLDPAYPPDRLAAMLADSGAAVLVGVGDTVDDLPVARTRTMLLDDPLVEATLPALPSTAPPGRVLPGQLAYVIYTSGSTGTPKGVQVTHGGLANLVAAQRPVFGVREGEVVLQFASFGFDASVWELVMALAAGAVLVPAGGGRGGPGPLPALVA
ncbi:AMP-binding protein, partial [Micromonospora sp. CPCC 205371]|nr:AMP-binding protein [Micromonospora sp. CPCC 205371]